MILTVPDAVLPRPGRRTGRSTDRLPGRRRRHPRPPHASPLHRQPPGAERRTHHTAGHSPGNSAAAARRARPAVTAASLRSAA
ncbi:hypothetical protein C5746_17900 [Streptomyces atratus]|uniref:Uncharacterized protein n=1 Tax=Streptomyces atratus TaxID=1893 RepID=A0A2Z5JDS4_STRAR|nr:hypothetical protein C5746_17900 [Streptomyces atratus]